MSENETRHVVSVLLPPTLAAASLSVANANGISRSELVRRLLTEYLAHEEKS